MELAFPFMAVPALAGAVSGLPLFWFDRDRRTVGKCLYYTGVGALVGVGAAICFLLGVLSYNVVSWLAG